MRWPFVAALSATLAVLACRSLPVDHAEFPSGTPRRCAYLRVDNQNFNRANIYLTEGHVKVGEVEGKSLGVLRVCPPGPDTPERFDIEGFANSFKLQLSNGLLFDPARLITMVIGADPSISFLGGA